jgi:hypothetical protein
MQVSIYFNGSEEAETFNSIGELKKFLNSAYYYASNLLIFDTMDYDYLNYNELTDFRSLFSSAKYYDTQIHAVQIFN